jgi:hypothetical protein
MLYIDLFIYTYMNVRICLHHPHSSHMLIYLYIMNICEFKYTHIYKNAHTFTGIQNAHIHIYVPSIAASSIPPTKAFLPADLQPPRAAKIPKKRNIFS